jgi:hypothetical protein
MISILTQISALFIKTSNFAQRILQISSGYLQKPILIFWKVSGNKAATCELNSSKIAAFLSPRIKISTLACLMFCNYTIMHMYIASKPMPLI